MNDPFYGHEHNPDHYEFTRNSKLSQWEFKDKRVRPEVVAWILAAGIFLTCLTFFVSALYQ